jgi:DNA-binding IscR family transcriptional regulator
MREVIEAVDGPLHLNVCMISDKSCIRQRWCPAHPVWVEAQQALMQILTRTVIADLASQAQAAPVLAPRLAIPGKTKARRPAAS